MEKHVTVVAVLQIGLSILGFFLGVSLIFILGIVGANIHDDVGEVLLPILGLAIGGFFAVTSLLAVIGGIGLLKRKNWARILILVLSAFDLLNIPFGTALAIYTIWVLVQDETVALFRLPKTATV
jgi:NADH:ubiquinone oxidoreductase subunit K